MPKNVEFFCEAWSKSFEAELILSPETYFE